METDTEVYMMSCQAVQCRCRVETVQLIEHRDRLLNERMKRNKRIDDLEKLLENQAMQITKLKKNASAQ